MIGSATALHLAQGGADVVVIERDPTYARASSSLSGSAIRQQFSTPVNIRLSQYGRMVIRDADVGLREPGYLYLASECGLEALQQNHAVQQAHGADIALLPPAAIAERFPWLRLEGLAGATLGLTGEGWFDGPALHRHFRSQARALGARYVHAEATGLRRLGERIDAVRLADGSEVPADMVVNAAGPAARHVAAMAGIAIPVEARKRCIFVFQCRTPLPLCPLVIDTTGVWFRPEGDRFLAGISPDDTEDTGLDVNHAEWDEVVWPAIAARVPAFQEVRLTSAWAGHYEYNTFDHNALLGILPEAPNLVFANGFSGHGMQHAAGAGRGLAELILHGEYRSIDLSPLDVNRLAQNRPLLERNVI